MAVGENNLQVQIIDLSATVADRKLPVLLQSDFAA